MLFLEQPNEDAKERKQLKAEIESSEKKLYEYIENAITRKREIKRLHDLREKVNTLHLLEASRRKQNTLALGDSDLSLHHQYTMDSNLRSSHQLKDHVSDNQNNDMEVHILSLSDTK